MVQLHFFFSILLPFVLVAASVVPFDEMKREPDSPTHVAREQKNPSYPGEGETSSRQARHLRPEYGATKIKREITPPDVGQVATFPPTGIPQPTREPRGGARLSPSNEEIDRQNPDYVTPPPSDGGTLPNLKWTFSLSHNGLYQAGWVREQTITDLPSSKAIAGAEVRMNPNAYRELHWHRVGEWGIVLKGTGRITAVDGEGRTYISDIIGPRDGDEPDIFTFPPGVAHGLQALEEGLEVLLLFSDGDFDARGTTFQASDWLVHTPLEIVAQNLGLSTSDLEHIPEKAPVIFDSTVDPPPEGQADDQAKDSPAGEVPNPYVFRLSEQDREVGPGGWIKIQDSTRNFPASWAATAYVHVRPSGLRELHWHPDEEWIYIISGKGRATAFAGSASSRTFDLQAGDSAVFPSSYGHYIKNLSPTHPLIFIEVFNAPRYIDFSATQWLALTPSQTVADLLKITIEQADRLVRKKRRLIPGGVPVEKTQFLVQ